MQNLLPSNDVSSNDWEKRKRYSTVWNKVLASAKYLAYIGDFLEKVGRFSCSFIKNWKNIGFIYHWYTRKYKPYKSFSFTIEKKVLNLPLNL